MGGLVNVAEMLRCTYLNTCTTLPLAYVPEPYMPKKRVSDGARVPIESS